MFRAEHAGVLTGARGGGVRRVLDRLEPHETADVRALEGAGPRPRTRRRPPISSPAYRLAAGAAGAFLVGRALLGGGFLRIPRASRARRYSGASSGTRARRASGRTRGTPRRSRRGDARRSSAGRARRHRAHPGRSASTQVREVKSPAELEPGIASARPDPLRRGRVDRSDLRGERGERGSARRPTTARARRGGRHVAPHEGVLGAAGRSERARGGPRRRAATRGRGSARRSERGSWTWSGREGGRRGARSASPATTASAPRSVSGGRPPASSPGGPSRAHRAPRSAHPRARWRRGAAHRADRGEPITGAAILSEANATSAATPQITASSASPLRRPPGTWSFAR